MRCGALPPRISFSVGVWQRTWRLHGSHVYNNPKDPSQVLLCTMRIEAFYCDCRCFHAKTPIQADPNALRTRLRKGNRNPTKLHRSARRTKARTPLICQLLQTASKSKYHLCGPRFHRFRPFPLAICHTILRSTNLHQERPLIQGNCSCSLALTALLYHPPN